MSQNLLRLLFLGCLLLAGSCLSDPDHRTTPAIDENALPQRPDTAGLRSRPRQTSPEEAQPQLTDTLLPEIALRGTP